MYQKMLVYKKTSITLLVVCLLFISFLVWGFTHYTKAAVINRYIAARSSDKGEVFDNIKEYLVWSDTREKITFDEANYAEFSKLQNSDKEAVRKELESATSSDNLYVTSIGRKFGIFPNYKIAMKPMELTITTNVPNMDILLNQKKVTTSDSDQFTTTIKHLPQANYTAWLEGTYKDKKIKVSKEYDGNTNTINLDVSFKNFTVTSNVTDGELYFDKTHVGTLTNGQYEVSDYPLTQDAQVFVSKTFSDGDVISEKKSLSQVNDGDTVALNVSDLLDNTTAGQLVIDTFDQLVQYVATQKDSSTVSTIFENGTSNAFYKALKTSIQAKMSTDKRVASSFNIPNIVLNGVTQVGKESYVLDFAVTYDFYYDKSTDTTNGKYGDVIQQLTGNLTVKKSGNSYQVATSGQQNLTVVSEDNQLKKDTTSTIFPSQLIGTWTGTSDGATLTYTFASDGTITKKSKLSSSSSETETKAKITKLTEKSDGIYLYDYDSSSDVGTFTFTGMGGTGIKYAYGIKFDGTKATLLVWQTGTNDEFDYTKPALSLELTKE